MFSNIFGNGETKKASEPTLETVRQYKNMQKKNSLSVSENTYDTIETKAESLVEEESEPEICAETEVTTKVATPSKAVVGAAGHSAVEGIKPTTRPKQLSDMGHLVAFVRDCEIYSLDSIAKSCGMRLVSTKNTVDLLSVNGTIISSVPEDSFKSGHHLLAVSLAKYLTENGVEKFQVDLNLSARIKAIENSGVFNSKGEGTSYATYLALLTAEPSYDDPVQVNLNDLRDDETGVWSLELFKSGILDEDAAASSVIVYDVESSDIPKLAQVKDFTLYFQAPKTYIVANWKHTYNYVRTAQRKDFPKQCKLYPTEWVVIGSEDRESPMHPMVAGPECLNSVQAVVAQLEEARRRGLWVVPNVMGMPIQVRSSTEVVTNQQSPCSIKSLGRDAALKALPDHLRPTREHYETLAEAVKLGQSGGLEYIKGKGIVRGNYDIFGNCLNSSGLPASFRRDLLDVNKVEKDMITKFHKYIKVLSEAGAIQESGRVPPQPILVALWQLVRSYSQAGCHPQSVVDYEWCLDN